MISFESMLSTSELRSEEDRDARHYLARIARGDAQALERLYDLWASPLLSIVMRILRNREQAEEVIQDTFIRIWKHAKQYDETRSTPFSWGVTIARRRAIDVLRYEASRPHGDEDDSTSRLERYEVEPDRQRIEDCDLLDYNLKGISALQRTCLEAVYFEGLTQAEVALKLKKPLGTVKSEIRRALQRLKDQFKGD